MLILHDLETVGRLWTGPQWTERVHAAYQALRKIMGS